MKKILTYLGFLGIAALATYQAFKGVDLDELWELIVNANKFYVILAMIFGYLAIISRGIRWVILLEPLGHKPKLWNCIHSVALAYLSNILVPRSGEIARCGALNQTDNIPMDELIGTVISERVVDFVMLFLFLAIAIFTNTEAFFNMYQQWTEGAEGGSSNLIYYIIGVIGIGLVLFMLFWRKIKTTKIYMKIVDFLEGVVVGLKSVMKMKKKWTFIFHTLFIWLMYYLMAYVVFYSMEGTQGITIFKALFVMVAGGFGMVLPSPGGMGTYQYAVLLGFLALGMSEINGVAYGNLEWIAQTIMMLLSGALGFYMIGRAKIAQRQKLKEELKTN